LSDKCIDLVLAISQISPFYKVTEFSRTETTSWVAELEWPEEVCGLLEVGANSVDLVNEILNADNAILAKVLLNNGVVGESNALLVDLSISTLVNELTDRLEVGVSVGNPWFDNLQHLECSFGETDEDTVVDLEKAKELEDLAGLGSDLVDTLDTDNKD